MPKLTRPQLCKMLGCTDEVIRKQVSLGALIEVDGYTDTDHPVNVKYIAGRVERMQNGKRVGRKPARHRQVPEIEDESFEQLVAKVGMGMGSSDLDALRADKLVEETELLRMRKEKLRGELLPIDLVTPVFVLFSKAMQTAFSDELEDIVREVSHAAKMNKQQTADLRKRVVDVINSATDKGVGEAKKGIRRLTLEYSDTRGRGERIG
jgi:hypothetical protein